MKIKTDGDIAWFKLIVHSENNYPPFESIEEAFNGNIFIAFSISHRDDQPYLLYVFSQNGQLLTQKKFGFPNIVSLGKRTTRIPLISRLNQDSVIIGCFATPESGEGDLITLLTSDNHGNLGQAVSFMAPVSTIRYSNFNNLRIVDNVI